MNIFGLALGFLVAAIIIVRFKKTRLETNKYCYPFLLFTFPLYYFLFAIYGNDYAAIPLEIIGGLLFFVLALSVLKLNAFYRFSLLAIGYIFHGVYDITHNLYFINLGTPIWWPEFCGVIDFLIGLYLVNLACKSRANDAQ